MSRPAMFTREYFVAKGRKGGLAGDPKKKALAGAIKSDKKIAAAKRNLVRARRIRIKLAKKLAKEAHEAAAKAALEQLRANN